MIGSENIFICPECDSEAAIVTSDGEMTNFLCARCHRCWHIELGYIFRVDPITCPGCEYRPACLTVDEDLERLALNGEPI